MSKRFAIGGFFAGAGGLDLGFKNAGFDTVFANEFDKKITPTFRANFPETHLDDRSLFDVPFSDIPDDLVGIIGGPPCQSWSLGGLGKGLSDKRGEVFIRYINVIAQKKPHFFLAENVKGMLASSRKDDLQTILDEFDKLGYNLTYKLLNAADYSVPQDRERLIFVGYRKDLGKEFVFPEPHAKKVTLKDAIWDLRDSALPALALDKTNGTATVVPNHEYSTGGFSSQFMSRNRIRGWEQQSFTIQASGRQAPLHPDSGKMVKVATDLFKFDSPDKVRRLSVREAARIQTFPEDFKFM
jgi:DNA (cytosine-5)-methyltransferase 1